MRLLPFGCPCGRCKSPDVPRKTFALTKSVDIDTKSIRSTDARWEHEASGTEGLRGSFDRFVESTGWEVVVTTFVVADLVLTVLTFIASEEVGESEIVFILSAVFLFVLIVDVCLRAIKDGYKFLGRWLNWLEAFVAVASLVLLILDGIRRSCSGSDCSDGGGTGRGASLGRAVRPLLRVFRVMRAASHLLLNRGGVVGKADRIADKLVDAKIRKLIDKFVLCPSDNIESKPSKGHFHIEKAQIKSRIFENVHLPFTILGGLIDLVHVDVDLVKGRKVDLEEKQHRLLVIVENVVLVVGPGHHQEEPAPMWTYEAVLEKKEKIVDFIIGQTENIAQMFPKKQQGRRSRMKLPGKNSVDNFEASTSDKSVASRPSLQTRLGAPAVKNKAADRLKNRVKQVVEEVLANGMHVSLRNIEIRYEDRQGELTSGKQVVGAFEVGSVQVRAQGVAEDHAHEEDDFRVKGRWRPGIEADFLEPEKETGTMSKGTSATTSSKRLFSNGVRAAMHVNRMSAYWDVNEADKAAKSVLYGPYLQESMNIDLLSFLSECKSRRACERMRWAIAGEVEKRLTAMTGRCMQERVRRLRDVVSLHRYLLHPFSCSVHGVYRPRRSGNFSISQDPDVEDAEKEIEQATHEVEEMIESLRRVDRKKAHEFERRFARLMADSENSLNQVSSEFWPPQTDIDVHIPRIPFTVDIAQARSLVELAAYVKRWYQEDNRIMWQTTFKGHASFTPKQIVSLRWGYALRQVLHGIDPKFRWLSLPWWEIMRTAKMRTQYLEALTEDLPSEQKIARLQVALPLLEICVCRRASETSTDDRRKKRERARRASKASKTSLGTDLEMGPTQSLVSQSGFEHTESEGASKSMSFCDVKSKFHEAKEDLKELGEVRVPSSAKSLQFHLRVGQMQAYLVQPQNMGARRSLLRFEAAGLVMAAARHAPRKIWMQLAPPNAVVNALQGNSKAFEEVAAEVGLQDIRAVFCGMPSSASQLRRLVGAPRIHVRTVSDPLSDANLANSDKHIFDLMDSEEERSHGVKAMVLKGVEAIHHHKHPTIPSRNEARSVFFSDAPRRVFSDGRREEKFFMQMRVAFLGNEIQEAADGSNAPAREVARWEFAAWTMPLEVNLCHPLMKQLALNFKPREKVPRWLSTVNDVWQTFTELRQLHDEKTVKRLKKKRKFEVLMGCAGPFRDRWITGEVLMRGAMRGARYDAYSEATWLKRAGVIPKGKLKDSWWSDLRWWWTSAVWICWTWMKIERLVNPARLHVAFIPTREKHGPYASKDGWLFATECEALAADKLVQGGAVKETKRKSSDSRQEDAGCDAYEDPKYQEPLFTLPECVLRNWGVNPFDGSLRSRFRPPVSALGVKPLAPWRTSMGTKILPGCPKELLCCSCSSFERNLPTSLQPAALAIKSTMPENCPKEWFPDVGDESCPPASKQSEERRHKPLPLALPSTPSPESAGQLRGWAKVKHQEEAKAKAMPPPPSLFGIDGTVEAMSHDTLGLPPPTQENLHIWWRSLGIMVD